MKFAVVHPVEPSTAQVVPEKPFVHMQLQDPDVMEFVPPFRHVRAVSQEDIEAAELVDGMLVVLFLWRTRSSTGMTTAATTIMTPIRRRIIKQQIDIPQHVFLLFLDLLSWPSSKPRGDPLKPSGH